jgi:hypothetical protein
MMENIVHEYLWAGFEPANEPIPFHYTNIELDIYTIMPNNARVILALKDDNADVVVRVGFKPVHTT